MQWVWLNYAVAMLEYCCLKRSSILSLGEIGNFCTCIGCSNRGDKDKSFYHLSSVITHQGEQTRQLSEERRRQSLTAI